MYVRGLAAVQRDASGLFRENMKSPDVRIRRPYLGSEHQAQDRRHPPTSAHQYLNELSNVKASRSTRLEKQPLIIQQTVYNSYLIKVNSRISRVKRHQDAPMPTQPPLSMGLQRNTHPT